MNINHRDEKIQELIATRDRETKKLLQIRNLKQSEAEEECCQEYSKLDKDYKEALQTLMDTPIEIGPNQLVATHQHHFSAGSPVLITLIITGDKWKWKIKGIQKDEMILDPKNNLDDFIHLIDIVFRFTGVCFDTSYSNTFTNYIDIQQGSDMGMDTLGLIRWIYNQPLEHDIKFIQLSTCGCNMGHCGALTGIDISDVRHRTYGDLMKLFGDPIKPEEDPDNEYYAYPDGSIFRISKIDKLPSKMFGGDSCHNEQVPVLRTLDPNISYLAWDYTC